MSFNIVGDGFEFDGGVTVYITTGHEVVVNEPPSTENGSKAFCCVFSGFPDYQEAELFVFWGDFDPPGSNTFFERGKGIKRYNLTYTCTEDNVF